MECRYSLNCFSLNMNLFPIYRGFFHQNHNEISVGYLWLPIFMLLPSQNTRIHTEVYQQAANPEKYNFWTCILVLFSAISNLKKYRCYTSIRFESYFYVNVMLRTTLNNNASKAYSGPTIQKAPTFNITHTHKGQLGGKTFQGK